MKIPSSEHVVYINLSFVFVSIFRTIYAHNMFWACSIHVLNWQINEQFFVILWIVDVWIPASDKDLPVQTFLISAKMLHNGINWEVIGKIKSNLILKNTEPKLLEQLGLVGVPMLFWDWPNLWSFRPVYLFIRVTRKLQKSYKKMRRRF